MQTYLVESYVPRLRASDCRAATERARKAADELSRNGMRVRYLRSLFVAEDETCFHVFEGSSKEAVARVSEQAGLAYARIVPVSLDDWTRERQRETIV